MKTFAFVVGQKDHSSITFSNLRGCNTRVCFGSAEQAAGRPHHHSINTRYRAGW